MGDLAAERDWQLLEAGFRACGGGRSSRASAESEGVELKVQATVLRRVLEPDSRVLAENTPRRRWALTKS